MTLLFITLIATAILAGILQGGYHVKPWEEQHKPIILVFNVEAVIAALRQFDFGIRGWKWQKYEHAIWGAVIIGSMIIGHYLISNAALTSQYLVTVYLMAVLANDLFEYGYSYARFKTLINPYPENFTIGDLVVKIPWAKKVTWAEIETVGHGIGDLIDMEYTKWVFTWLQILPFHVSSWKMHAVRSVLIVTLTVSLFWR